MKLRVKLWPDLSYLTSEPKLLKMCTYFLYKNCPFRLDRVATGKAVTGSRKHGGGCAEKRSPFLMPADTKGLKQHGSLF